MKTPPEVSGVRPSSFIAVWNSFYSDTAVGKGATPELSVQNLYETTEYDPEDINLDDVTVYEIIREGGVKSRPSYEFKWNSP